MSCQWSVYTLNIVGSNLPLRNSCDKTKLQYFTQNWFFWCTHTLSLVLKRGFSGFFCFYKLSRYFPVKVLHTKIYKNRFFFFFPSCISQRTFAVWSSQYRNCDSLRRAPRTKPPLTFNRLGLKHEPQEERLPLARAELFQFFSVSCAHPARETERNFRLFCNSRFGIHYSYEWPTPKDSLFVHKMYTRLKGMP